MSPAEGRLSALRKAVERVGGEVFSLALYSLGSREEAMAVAQDAFLRAYLEGELERDEEGLRVALLSEVVGLIRRAKGGREPDLVELRRQGKEVVPELEAVLRGLLKLPVEERLVLLLCEWMGFSVEEAGRMMGEGKKAGRLLKRARERFARAYATQLGRLSRG